MKGFCKFPILQGFKEKSYVHIVKKIALNGKLYIIHEYDTKTLVRIYMCVWKKYVIILYFVGKFMIKSLFGKNDHGLDSQFPLWSSLSKESTGK